MEFQRKTLVNEISILFLRYVNMKNRNLFLAIVLVAIVFFTSCMDDDSFTTSPSAVLTFETDTVRMDTTFSNVPTTTRSFWIYNNSNAGLRLASVRLENGISSGYRVNVNGSYMSASSNYRLYDIEIRKGDSIRVFVELTSATTGKEDPQLVEDNLIFTLESAKEHVVNLCGYSWDADLLDALHISQDTLISSTRPIVLKHDIQIDSMATLTLGAGTTVYFHQGAGISVDGALHVDGTAGHPVILRSDRLDNLFDYLPYDRTPGLWKGVIFNPGAQGCIEHLDLHSSYNGVYADSSTVTMGNSIIHNCQGAGLYAVNCKLDIVNSQFSNTLGNCVDINGGDVSFNHCTFAQFYPFSANREYAFKFDESWKSFVKLHVRNSLITGYADDEMLGIPGSDSLKNCFFDYCIIRTPAITTNDSVRFTHIVYEDVSDTTMYGRKHFVLLDTSHMIYDFHLSEKSAAINAGDKSSGTSYDHDGTLRDSIPDIGAYEFVRKETEK